MESILCRLAAAFASAPGSLAPVPLDLAPPHALVAPVRVNGQGPFRLVLDTGAQSSALSPAAAAAVGLEARAAVEMVTVAGSSVVPVYSGDVTVGEHTFRSVELLSYAPSHPGIDGTLGQNVLGRVPFLLDIARRKLWLDPCRRLADSGGARIALSVSNGRALAAVRLDGERARLVLDSGASDLILFRRGRGGDGAVSALGGDRAEARIGRVGRVEIGPLILRDVRAGFVEAVREEAGLLPVRWFASVYLDLPGREAIVAR